MRRDPTTRDADDHRLLEVDELEATDVVDAHEGKASPMRRCQPGWHRIEYSPMVGGYTSISGQFRGWLDLRTFYILPSIRTASPQSQGAWSILRTAWRGACSAVQ